jgi:hypothetical protein
MKKLYNTIKLLLDITIIYPTLLMAIALIIIANDIN